MTDPTPSRSERGQHGRARRRTPAEYRQLIIEVSQRTAQLDRERTAITELLGGLKAEERGLVDQISAIQEECDDLMTRIEMSTERVAEVDAPMRDAEQATAVRALELETARRRYRMLADEVQQLARELDGYRHQASVVSGSCGIARGSVMRIGYKLKHGGGDEQP